MSSISDAVVDDLTFDPDVDASGITVEDRDGEVVLAGSVPSYPQHLEAAAAGEVSGVPLRTDHGTAVREFERLI